ncbi:MAG: ribose-5-phosphate isomerase RpiA [Chlamydiia bacterium]|nr:ribose-5-phosphate isomerase RpiA [Chlamydiia bacterium]
MQTSDPHSNDVGKRTAASRAAALIESNRIVGLGSGTTAAFFVEALGQRCKEGVSIRAVASSPKTEHLAIEHGVPLIPFEEVDFIDITCDGADAVDPAGRLIKGGGGALLREKILVGASKMVVIMVDASKCVAELLRSELLLPVDIAPFGWRQTLRALSALGLAPTVRMDACSRQFVTADGHWVVDLDTRDCALSPEELDAALKKIPGVMETGLFIGFTDLLLIGGERGEVSLRDY